MSRIIVESNDLRECGVSLIVLADALAERKPLIGRAVGAVRELGECLCELADNAPLAPGEAPA